VLAAIEGIYEERMDDLVFEVLGLLKTCGDAIAAKRDVTVNFVVDDRIRTCCKYLIGPIQCVSQRRHTLVNCIVIEIQEERKLADKRVVSTWAETWRRVLG